MVLALTCSTGRPECLRLCRMYVERQTVQAKHLVVEGGSFWQNYGRAFREADDDVVVFEDDDWYPPDWIEVCMTHLQHAPVFGNPGCLVYHVKNGSWETSHDWPCNGPLHATAFRKELLPWLRTIDERTPGATKARPPLRHGGKPLAKPCLENLIWTQHQTDKLFCFRVVGMKGMPGLKGFSTGHQDRFLKNRDKDRSMLRRLIGTDIEHYRPYFQC